MNSFPPEPTLASVTKLLERGTNILVNAQSEGEGLLPGDLFTKLDEVTETLYFIIDTLNKQEEPYE